MSDIAVGGIKLPTRLLDREIGEEHEDGELCTARSLCQRFFRLCAASFRRFHDDAPRPFFKLGVGTFDIDHEVAVDLAETDHRARGEHVEDDFLRRARLDVSSL